MRAAAARARARHEPARLWQASWVALTDAIEHKLRNDDSREAEERTHKAELDSVVQAAISASRQACAPRRRPSGSSSV